MINQEFAIEIQNISKIYQLGVISGPKTIRETINNLFSSQKYSRDQDNTLHALSNISFKVKRGERIGIIGKNGAGKSTLLKILSRVITPSSGSAIVRGKLASLLEIGTGFHPELTGRENIYINAAILGMTREEIESKVHSIIHFSGIDKFIDTPVKRYSSGMYVRLAFSVASHIDHDILIVDEVLAVGDQDFQNKCLEKIRELSSSGKTILFVSHNLRLLDTLCDRLILLDEGKIVIDDSCENVLARYAKKITDNSESYYNANSHQLESDLAIKSIEILNSKNVITDSISMCDPIVIRVTLQNKKRHSLSFSVQIKESDMTPVFHFPSADVITKAINAHTIELTCSIPNLNIYPGKYILRVAVNNITLNSQIEVEKVMFKVTQNNSMANRPLPRSAGLIFLKPEWNIQEKIK